MVRVLSLQARNFKKLDIDAPLKFPEGLILISGLNESGKSTLLDAILFALYGEVIRPPKWRKEDVVRYQSNDASVVLDFELGSRKYRIRRQISKNKGSKASLDEWQATDTLRSLAVGYNPVTTEVEKLLGGITFKELISSNVVAQKQLDRLLGLAKQEKIRIINIFLNLESFNTVRDAFDEERRELEGTSAKPGRVTLEQKQLESIRVELEEYERQQDSKRNFDEDLKKARRHLKSLEITFKETGAKNELLKEYDRTLTERGSLEVQIRSQKKTLSNLNRQMGEIKKSIAEKVTEQELYRDLPKLSDLFARIESTASRLAELESDAAKEQGRLPQLDEQIAGIEAKVPQSKLAEIDGLRQKSRSTKAFIVLAFLSLAGGLGSSGLILASLPLAVAFYTSTAYALAMIAIRASRAAKLASYESLGGEAKYADDLKEQRESIAVQIATLQGEAKTRGSELTLNIRSLPVRYLDKLGSMQIAPDGTEMLLAAVEKVEDQQQVERSTVETLDRSLNDLRNQLAKLPSQEELGAMTAEVSTLEKKLEDTILPTLPEGVEFSKEGLSEVEEELRELNRGIGDTRRRIQTDENRIKDCDQYVAEHSDVHDREKEQKAIVDQIQFRLKVLQRSLEAIANTSESLRMRVRPMVERYMGQILPRITSNRYRVVRLDDDYNLSVWDPEAGEFKPKEVFSGGTEDQFLFAMRLAFALSLMPEVKGRKPEFLFLDEPLGSSDELRRSGILEFLSIDLREKFRQIFLVSHVGGLEDSIINVIRLDNGRISSSESSLAAGIAQTEA